MDNDSKEMIEASAKGVAAGVTQPIVDAVTRYLDAPALEISYMIADRIRFWRLQNFVKLRYKVDRLLEQYQIKDFSRISLSTAYPLLERGLLEDDETLQDKWAALLAGAVDPRQNHKFDKIYFELLSLLTPLEAKLLDIFIAETEDFTKSLPPIPPNYPSDSDIRYRQKLFGNIGKYFDDLEIGLGEYEIIITNLVRMAILEFFNDEIDGGVLGGKTDYHNSPKYTKIQFTPLGYNFVKRCNMIH